MMTSKQVGYKHIVNTVQRFLQMALFSLVVTAAGGAKAVNIYFDAVAGDWSVDNNWLGGNKPTADDNAYVRNAHTCSVSQTGGVCSFLFIANDSGDLGTLQMTSGDLTIASAYVGYSGKGLFQQAGGTVDCERIYLGTASSGMGCTCKQGAWCVVRLRLLLETRGLPLIRITWADPGKLPSRRSMSASMDSVFWINLAIR